MTSIEKRDKETGWLFGDADGRELFTILASMVYLTREKDGNKQVLLQKRGKGSRTGVGQWDASASGHTDAGESLLMTAIRETKEEIGIDFNEKDVVKTVVVYCKSEGYRLNAHFFISSWKGEPTICEKDKNDELKWFDLDKLPDSLCFDRGQALDLFMQGASYGEKGWRA
ncbi:NUDIX domain-containing protein [Candidatus Saccharibacteria bacterium]|nr:NUDIX domain-containing protein [Candidatus Saccharibacteria bacterium]